MIPTLILLFVVGAVTGSFLNVCIYRLPRRESVIAPASHCPECDRPLNWYDNIPLVSYLALRGKCRRCGTSIPVRYPLVELLNAVLFVLAGWRFGLTAELFPALLLISTLIVVFFIDLEHYIIPNIVVLPVAAVGVTAMVAISLSATDPDFPSWWTFPLAGVASAGFFFLITLIFPKGMGMGDVKLAGMLGFFLGRSVTVGLFLGFLLGALVGIGLIAAGRKGRKSRVPFGPFLAVGALAALFFGNELMQLYLGLFDSPEG
ncbi:MAG: prepilin peptidase [Thermoleophilia bacterium]|nr:prepilin peptidase [Thermoleophilia bacterium]